MLAGRWPCWDACGAGTPVAGMAVSGVGPVGTAGARGARLGVGVAQGRSASRGRNSVRPVGRVGTIRDRCDGGSPQSGHELPRLLTDPCVWGTRGSPGWFGRSDALSSPPAGAYYPAQGVQQFPAGVPTAQVIVSQQPPIPPKRERKTVRSRPPPAAGGDSQAGGGGCQPRGAGRDVVQGNGRGRRGAVPPRAGGAERGERGAWRVLATLAVPAGGVVLSHGSRGGGGAAAANCCLLPEMPVLGGLQWGLFIAGSRAAAGMAPRRGCCQAGGAGMSSAEGPWCPLGSALAALGAGQVWGWVNKTPGCTVSPPESWTHACPPFPPQQGALWLLHPQQLGASDAAGVRGGTELAARAFVCRGWSPVLSPRQGGVPAAPVPAPWCLGILRPLKMGTGLGTWRWLQLPGSMACEARPAPCCPCPPGIMTRRCLWGTVPRGDGRCHPPVPKLCVARVGTALNEPLPLEKWVSRGCRAQGRRVAPVLCPPPH